VHLVLSPAVIEPIGIACCCLALYGLTLKPFAAIGSRRIRRPVAAKIAPATAIEADDRASDAERMGAPLAIRCDGRNPEAAQKAERRESLLHTVGNLTLLTQELNPSVSNGPWDRKLESILKHSVLNLKSDAASNMDGRHDRGALQRAVQDRPKNPPGGQGIAGSNPAIPTNLGSFHNRFYSWRTPK
jgi:hypothetical protein